MDGNAEIRLSNSELDEDEGLGNLNPFGVPYPFPRGLSDNDAVDSYSSEIRGLVYVSLGLRLAGDTSVKGLVLSGGNCQIQSNATIRISADETYRLDPPPGFEASTFLELRRGSMAAVTDDAS